MAFFVFPATDVVMPLYLLLVHGAPLSIVLTWGVPLGCYALAGALATRAEHS